MADGEDRPWTRGEVVPLASARRAEAQELWVDSEAWVEGDLPRRPWIVHGYLLRGHVTLLVGAGAAGKSMLLLGWSVALALGKPWGRFGAADLRLAHKVLVYNVEDDQLEQRSRLSAALRQWEVAPKEISARVVRCGPTQTGALLQFDPVSGTVSPTPLMDRLRAEITLLRPDVVSLDPLVELHTSGENDNAAMRAVVAFFRSIAREFSCAVIVCHHVKKGLMEPGDIDASRGGGSVPAAARVGLTMQAMRTEDAEELGVQEEARADYCRVDGGKSNYAPAREATWFHKQEYELDNGELVSALVPWTPPGAHAAPLETIAAIVADIERGAPGGDPWSPKLSGDKRSIRALLRQHGVTGRKAEAATIDAIEAAGVRIAPVWSAAGNKAQGYRTDAGPAARWIVPRTPKS